MKLGALAAAMLIGISVAFFSVKAEPVVGVEVRAVAGQEAPQPEPFKFVQLVTPPIPAAEPVAEVKVEPKPISKPKPVVPTVSAPVPPVQPAAPEPVVVTSVSACLAKFVGTPCTFTASDGETLEGTCMTPGFSPVTCVPHTQ